MRMNERSLKVCQMSLIDFKCIPSENDRVCRSLFGYDNYVINVSYFHFRASFLNLAHDNENLL